MRSHCSRRFVMHADLRVSLVIEWDCLTGAIITLQAAASNSVLSRRAFARQNLGKSICLTPHDPIMSAGQACEILESRRLECMW